MNKKHIAVILFGLIVLGGFVTFSPVIISKLETQTPDSMYAAVSKASVKVLNVFVRPAMTYLQVDAPLFAFLPLERLNTSVFDPQSLVKSLSVILQPKTATPVVDKNLAQTTENTLVNIFCSQRIGNLRKTITGSGVLISDDGTVLTNAHVAEYPLVADSNNTVVCLGRSGSPAQHSYNVRVVFISPEWINASGKYINTMSQPETGQSDFALLRLTNTDGTPVHLRVSPVEESVGPIGSVVNAVSYPADVLGTKGVQASLYIQKEALTIEDTYSLQDGNSSAGRPDIIMTSASTVGQKGSSGGALTDSSGNLVGMITLATSPDQNGKKHIKALSIDYINRKLATYQGGGLQTILHTGSAVIENNFDSMYRKSLTSLLLGYLSL